MRQRDTEVSIECVARMRTTRVGTQCINYIIDIYIDMDEYSRYGEEMHMEDALKG